MFVYIQIIINEINHVYHLQINKIVINIMAILIWNLRLKELFTLLKIW